MATFNAPSSESIISEGVFHCNALLGSLHQCNATLSLPSKSSVTLCVISFFVSMLFAWMLFECFDKITSLFLCHP